MKSLKLQLKSQNFLKDNEGFSLIELLVAVAVFSVSMTIIIGTILAVSEAQQKILALRIVQDSLNYVFDTMAKEIRVGNSYHCGSIDDFSITPRDCALGGNYSLTFLNSNGDKITYQAKSNRIERVFEGGTPNQITLVLTAPEAIIANFKFYVTGALPFSDGDKNQPRVIFVLQGHSGVKERLKSYFNIQTTISQRSLDS